MDCHGGFNFTQSTSHEKQLIDRRPFHNTGLYQVINKVTGKSGYPEKDIGLAEISTLTEDNGRFRAPTLRNIEVSAPYMHDGSANSLLDAIRAHHGEAETSRQFFNSLSAPQRDALMLFLKDL